MSNTDEQDWRDGIPDRVHSGGVPIDVFTDDIAKIPLPPAMRRLYEDFGSRLKEAMAARDRARAERDRLYNRAIGLTWLAVCLILPAAWGLFEAAGWVRQAVEGL